MHKKLGLSLFALVAGAAFSSAAFAADDPRPIFIRIKAEAQEPAARATAEPQRQRDMAELKRLAANMQPLIPQGAARSAAERAPLERHNLTRYYKISAASLQGRDAEELVRALKRNPLVESAQVEPKPVSMSKQRPTPSTDADAIAPEAGERAAGIPDYTNCEGKNARICQNYMGPPDPASSYWKLGGVNAFEAHRINDHLGDKVRLVSDESDHWDYEHVDLPKPFIEHWHAEPHRTGSHDTSSAGIMFGRANGFGVTGIAPKAQAGYTKYGAEGLVDLRNVLQAGDVLQIGVQYDISDGCGPNVDCLLPVETVDLAFDAISYLTQEKGVHVILAAANGGVDLDAPHHQGRYDRRRNDSGAIYVGAGSPETGARNDFSEYGSRVDVFSWGSNVTTTTWKQGRHQLYTIGFAGTSSANPIIAGSVAWLQSLARERGLGNIAPKQMRQLLVDSGKPLPVVDPGKNIGTQPDLVRAAELLDRDGGAGPAPVAALTGPTDAQGGQRVELSAQASTGQDLTYAWSSRPALTFEQRGAHASFIAPTLQQDTDYRITVKVVDKQGRDSQASHDLRIKSSGSACLDAPAWDSKKTYSTFHETVVYDGKLYRQNFWNVGQRPDLNSAQFGKPWLQPEACGLVPPPVARIEGPSTANANDQVKLSAGGSGGKDLKYAWTSLDGIALQVKGAEATFKAPALEQDKNLTFRVEITDAQGRKANANHVVKVKGQSGGGGGGGEGGGGDDVPAYRPGTEYQAGDRVTNGGKIYECKPWPYTGWCGLSLAHYEPGKGTNWTDAWIAR